MDIKVRNKKGEIDLAMLEELMAQAGAGQIAGSDLKTEAKDLVALVRGMNSLSVTDVPKNQAPGMPPSVTGRNELDMPDSEAAEMYKLQNSVSFGALLEKIVNLLLNENENTAAKTSEARQASLLGKMQNDHKAVLENLKKSLAKAEEVSKMMRRMQAFAWVMAIFMVAIAVTSIFTAGSTLALGAAILGTAGAALGVVQQALSSAGVFKNEAEKYADKQIAKGSNKSRTELKQEYMDKVSTAFTVVSAALSIAALAIGIGGAIHAARAIAKEAAKRAQEVATKTGKEVTKELVEEMKKQVAKEFASSSPEWMRNIQQFFGEKGLKKFALGVSIVGASGGVAGGATNAGFNFHNTNLQKELADWQAKQKELQKGADAIQNAIEDENEAIKKVLMMIQDSASALGSILAEDNQTSNTILRNMERMA